MASTFANDARRSPTGSRIDLPLASAAALAVGFALFVMPVDLLSRAVEGSGLPQILSAAQPPLGMKARALVALSGTIGAFAVVLGLLKMLGRRGAPAPRRHEREAEFELEPAAPRLRRADVHPDAPARRPILAARELGEPERREPATQPFWRPDDFPREPDQAPCEAATEIREKPETLDLGGPEIELLQPEAFVAAEESAPPPEEFAPPSSVDEYSLPELMTRLERSLARRLRQKGVFPAPESAPVSAAASVAEPEPVPPAFAAEADDRLRSAIENLQKIAARAR